LNDDVLNDDVLNDGVSNDDIPEFPDLDIDSDPSDDVKVFSDAKLEADNDAISENCDFDDVETKSEFDDGGLCHNFPSSKEFSKHRFDENLSEQTSPIESEIPSLHLNDEASSSNEKIHAEEEIEKQETETEIEIEVEQTLETTENNLGVEIEQTVKIDNETFKENVEVKEFEFEQNKSEVKQPSVQIKETSDDFFESEFQSTNVQPDDKSTNHFSVDFEKESTTFAVDENCDESFGDFADFESNCNWVQPEVSSAFVAPAEVVESFGAKTEDHVLHLDDDDDVDDDDEDDFGDFDSANAAFPPTAAASVGAPFQNIISTVKSFNYQKTIYSSANIQHINILETFFATFKVLAKNEIRKNIFSISSLN